MDEMFSSQINCHNSIIFPRQLNNVTIIKRFFLLHKKSTSISPDSCAGNRWIAFHKWIYIVLLHFFPQCTDIIPTPRNYPHVPAPFVSFEGYNVSFLSAWVGNGFITICVRDILWIRICPFVCTYWSPAELPPWPKIFSYANFSNRDTT